MTVTVSSEYKVFSIDLRVVSEEIADGVKSKFINAVNVNKGVWNEDKTIFVPLHRIDYISFNN